MAELTEARLIEKLRALEALYARPGTTAEGQAAADAAERIVQRLAETGDDEPIEYRFSMPDMWSRRVFIALLRRHGIRPYRYRRQRYTTVMAKVSKRFVDDTLWPEYEAFSATLREYLGEVTDRIVSQVIHDDLTEAAVVEEPPQLTLGIDPGGNGSAKTAPKASQPKPPSPPAEHQPPIRLHRVEVRHRGEPMSRHPPPRLPAGLPLQRPRYRPLGSGGPTWDQVVLSRDERQGSDNMDRVYDHASVERMRRIMDLMPLLNGVRDFLP